MGRVTQVEREQAEIDYWANSPTERLGADFLDVFTFKLLESRVLLEKFKRFAPLFRRAEVILEVGGGQCWVSVMIKTRFGADKVVVGSDIAAEAVASVHEWERVFRAPLDGAAACRSYEIPMRDNSVDLVVVYAAAHHFGKHRRTLVEIERVLRPGGHALYLHEPGCRKALHGLALRRVMAKRPAVPEDVLVYQHLGRLAETAGLTMEVVFAPTTTGRGPNQTLYYSVLGRLPFLQRLLPCSVDLVFSKRTTPSDR